METESHDDRAPASAQGSEREIQRYRRFLHRYREIADLKQWAAGCTDGEVRETQAPILNVGCGLSDGRVEVEPAARPFLNDDEIWVLVAQPDLAWWGRAAPATKAANFLAVQYGGELRSAFHTDKGVYVSVVTNAARDHTMIRLDPGGALRAGAPPPPPGPLPSLDVG